MRFDIQRFRGFNLDMSHTLLIGFVLLLVMTFNVPSSYCDFKRNPIKETQTDPVPVTEELLSREYDQGPASPSFKMPDTTAGFFAKKPFDHILKAEFLEAELDSETLFSDEQTVGWFESDIEDLNSPEVLDEQELK